MTKIYTHDMSPTIQVRDLDPETLDRLKQAAEREGLTLSAFLRRELAVLGKTLDVRHRAEMLNSGSARTPLGRYIPGLEHISTQEIVDIIREDRGPIP